MLQSRRRRRHGTYPLAHDEAGFFGKRETLILGLIAIVAVWWALSSLLRGGGGMRVATILAMDGAGVHVTISGGALQRGEDGLRLYDGDTVQTDIGSHAVLQFFDGSTVRLDGGSILHLEEVTSGTTSSTLHMQLEHGRVWMETSTGAAITRLLTTPLLHAIFPPQSLALVHVETGAEGNEQLSVFDSSGPGLEVTLQNSSWAPAVVIVGEGQELSVTPQLLTKVKNGQLSSYDLRAALKNEIVHSPFYQWNMQRGKNVVQRTSESADKPVEASEQLVLLAPEDGSLLQGSTVLVKGRVGARVTLVRINGYSAPIAEGNFEKEIALPESEAVTVEVQAEDKEGLVVASKTLTLSHDIRPPDPPTITSPGFSGATVQVWDDTFEIVGEASADTTGISVNGYQLQKFTPGKPWHYLVDPAISNVHLGENTYEMVALDKSGNRSTPTRLTVLWKAQAAPTFEPTEEVSRNEAKYLARGSLTITAPASGTSYETNAEEVLIEGETSPDTAAISINGFALSKYLAGKVTWNYYASERFGNYHPGKNLFTIVARNPQGQILDVLRYTIERK